MEDSGERGGCAEPAEGQRKRKMKRAIKVKVIVGIMVMINQIKTVITQ